MLSNKNKQPSCSLIYCVDTAFWDLLRTCVVPLSHSLRPATDTALYKVLQDRLDFLGLVHSDL